MIRGPVLPQARDALWGLVAGRLDAIERGMTIVTEGFECAGGQLGAVDALARDAAGAPVLLLLATDGDVLLPARALGAAAFLERVGDALSSAVPEASFCPGTRGRVVVIATDTAAAAIDALARAPIAGLQLCRLEPFRVGGSERFAVRWLATAAATAVAAAGPTAAAVPPFAVPDHAVPLWDTVQALCSRIDAGIRVDGDRYRRRITWNGQTLAEVEVTDARLRAILPDGGVRTLTVPSDVRCFVDAVLRGYARHAGLCIEGREDPLAAPPASSAAPRVAVPARGTATRAAGDSLRSVLASARLTPEEYSALGVPTSAVGGEAEAFADDVARSVAAQPRSWPLPGRTD